MTSTVKNSPTENSPGKSLPTPSLPAAATSRKAAGGYSLSLKTRATARAEETRRKIYDTALELFREKGFDETTMRDIAAKAGVALGGAYYYFSAKDAIVLAFYREMQENSDGAIREALAGQKKLKDRVRGVLETRLELLEPNRKFCAALSRHAPNGDDPLSPFSEETRAIREHAMEHLRIAIEGGDVKVPADLKPRLPYLLWLYQMAVIMFWLYDRSAGQQRTRRLMEKSLALLINLLRISALPLMKPLRKAALELMEAATDGSEQV